jgi:hypothetical protein
MRSGEARRRVFDYGHVRRKAAQLVGHGRLAARRAAVFGLAIVGRRRNFKFAEEALGVDGAGGLHLDLARAAGTRIEGCQVGDVIWVLDRRREITAFDAIAGTCCPDQTA